MNIFKLLGIVFVAVGGGAICYILYKREYTALCRAEAWERLISFIGSQVECFALPIKQILSRVDGELLRDCGFRGASSPQDLRALIRGSVIEDRETRTLAEHFCGEFGRGYVDEQTARCKYFAGALGDRKKKLRADLPAKKKLYSTLCISASLAALIIFL